MSTRADDTGKSAAQIQEGYAIPDDFDIPNCTIEDVDRSVFSLFDTQLPFTYRLKEGQRKAPVIFATGERFAVLRRKEPLRDKAGALILPLISIMRTGVTQAPSMGAGTNQNTDLTIKKRLSPKDPVYQRLVNKKSLDNSDNIASEAARSTMVTGSDPGRLASRRGGFPESLDAQEGKLLHPELGKNIFEIITIPAPKYYTATYEVTFWTQYTVQMNDMLMALMSLYQSYAQRTFRLETPKGYWFVGYVDEALNPGNNFDDFTDSERLVRYSFNMTVPAYVVGSAFNTSQNVIRKYISAPEISFDADIFTAETYATEAPAGIPSGNPDSFILDHIRTTDEPLPGQAIAHPRGSTSLGKNVVANIGGAYTNSSTKVLEIEINPFTGELEKKRVFVKSRNRRSGETVLRTEF